MTRLQKAIDTPSVVGEGDLPFLTREPLSVDDLALLSASFKTRRLPVRPSTVRLAEALDLLPAGSIVTVTAGPGYDMGQLAEQWVKTSSIRAAILRPLAEGERLVDVVAETLHGLPNPPGVVLDGSMASLVAGLRDHPYLLLFDTSALNTIDQAEFAEYLDLFPQRSIVGILHERRPAVDLAPKARGRLVHIGQQQLAVTAEDFDSGLLRSWRAPVRDLVLDYAMGWPAAARVIAEMLALGVSTSDVNFLKAGLVHWTAEVVRANYSHDGDPTRETLLQVLADAGPVGTSELIGLGRTSMLAGVHNLALVPAVMTSQLDGWDVAPLARDILLTDPIVSSDERNRLVGSLAEADARADRPLRGAGRLLRVGHQSSLSSFTARWATRRALRGDPEIALELLEALPQHEAVADPDLLRAYAVADLMLVNIRAVSHWLDLLRQHEDPAAEPWSSRSIESRECLAEVAELEPPGEALLRGLSAPYPWTGIAHAVVAAQAIAAGDDGRAEGVLDAMARLHDDSLVVGGWRQSLLMDLYRRTGRLDRGLEMYRKVLASLEASKFAASRVTFFMDAALARLAQCDGDEATALMLANRSLGKIEHVRFGVRTPRLHALLLVAQTLHEQGEFARARAVLETAQNIAAEAPWATALVAELDGLTQARLTGAGAPVLTAAQFRVLTHLASPYSVPRIAELMFVSAATVRTHIRAIFKSLNVSSRGEAVDRAIELGLIDS